MDNLFKNFAEKKIFRRIQSIPLVFLTLNDIAESCEGEFYIVGGFIRDTLLGGGMGHDIDIMTNNGDKRIHDFMDKKNIPFSLNRHGIRQYNYNGILLDIYEPSQFQIGFNTIEECLRFYDLKINSFSFNYRSKQLFYPDYYDENLIKGFAGINLSRWEFCKNSNIEIMILFIRLINILARYPILKLSEKEILFLNKVLPNEQERPWKKLKSRYKGTKKSFRMFLNDKIECSNYN